MRKMMLKLPTLKLDIDKDAGLKWADAAGHRSSLIGLKSRFLGRAESVHHTTTITVERHTETTN
ncbi:hypothetical protein FOQG_05771 [Fusarium oxysporum f. sp. raphani 54005]|uniref:Uncharacterized protein n=4 Tax=Fusarium oxysporum TaxID=5507 RepID=X0CEX3_FUSOX|nr:hypothetical protein FOVG_05086 [Fusarium oxysporum f. sp. pisi HDV247]EXK92736.1 hypothetical protein FOQG_05771 [Fusarium oxysporum f. sp. raphani 54005]EXL78847.1 hypothetical protein FOPG_07064 [Fusarium oxysporum f. sp. conglutinans race 2 54008]EXM29657.1 hypothetical protein FOTG_04803 [Fusarium oxysporum f. sp. vasinfectum 25433]KAJ4110026.1 hypothetical protein NW769_007796 [Fusarium oxysporum]